MYNENQLSFIKDLASEKGCTFCNIIYKSDMKAPKKLGLGKVEKVVELNGQFNYDYETAVNNRLEKEGKPRSFNAQSLPWGTWLYPNKVIENKGLFYVRFYCVKNHYPDVEYIVNGRPATESEVATIKAWQSTLSKGSATQSASGLTDNQVEPRDVELDNIITFKCGGICYTKQRAVAVAV